MRGSEDLFRNKQRLRRDVPVVVFLHLHIGGCIGILARILAFQGSKLSFASAATTDGNIAHCIAHRDITVATSASRAATTGSTTILYGALAEVDVAAPARTSRATAHAARPPAAAAEYTGAQHTPKCVCESARKL